MWGKKSLPPLSHCRHCTYRQRNSYIIVPNESKFAGTEGIRFFRVSQGLLSSVRPARGGDLRHRERDRRVRVQHGIPQCTRDVVRARVSGEPDGGVRRWAGC